MIIDGLVFAYRGTVLLLGGMSFNVIVAALLYHPVAMHMKKVRVTENIENGDAFVIDEKCAVEIITPSTEESEKSPDQQGVTKTSGKTEKESEQPLLIEHSGRKLSAGFRRLEIFFSTSGNWVWSLLVDRAQTLNMATGLFFQV